MDQYTNYIDSLSQSMYPQQANSTSTFLSSESQPPSLSASPVSSEGSESFMDEAVQYGLFGYDQSPMAIYNSCDQKFATSSSAKGHPSPNIATKHEYSFGYDSHMMFDRDLVPSAPTYQPPIGYTPQERNPLAFDYPVHPSTVSTLANMLADSAPFATVAPSATSGLFEEEASAYGLSVGIGELSISSPTSSPFFCTESVGSSPLSLPMAEPQPTQVCDPKVLSSPMAMSQPAVQPGPSMQADGPRRTRSSNNNAFTVDSDYAPSGESEVEDENDQDYGEPPAKRKTRLARVSAAAHPYLKPASKAKEKKYRGTKLDIPTPVPGLTKNSRGRSVPKKAEVAPEPGTRPFWCNVKNCDKLFSRGEHLKRHITSIHTNNKRE